MWLERPLIHKSVHVEEKPNIRFHCGVRTYSSMTDKLLTFRDSEFNVNDILLRVSCRSRWRDGFPGGSSGKEPACQCRRCKTLRFGPWVGKIPWWRAWQPTPVFLPGELYGQRSLAGYSPWVTKGWTQLKHFACTHRYRHWVQQQVYKTYGKTVQYPINEVISVMCSW